MMDLMRMRPITKKVGRRRSEMWYILLQLDYQRSKHLSVLQVPQKISNASKG